MNLTPAIQRPESGVSDFATISPKDSLLGESSGLGAMFGNGVRRNSLEQHILVAACSQTNGQNEDLQPASDGDLDANFESEFDFPSQLDVAPQRQPLPYGTVANNNLLNDFDVNMLGQGIHFSDSLKTNSTIPSASQEVSFSSSTASKEMNFSSNATSQQTNFSPSAPNQGTRFNCHGFVQDSANDIFDFSGSLEKSPTALSASQETRTSQEFNLDVPFASPETSFYSDFDQDTTNNIPGMDFLGSLEASPNIPSTTTASQETSFSQEFIPNAPSLSQQTNFSQEFNTLSPLATQELCLSSQYSNPDTPPSTQESHYSTTSSSFLDPPPFPSTPSPSSPATSSTSSPERHPCNHCSRAFKRPGDLKRHEKKHFPGQMTFHCWQPGCDRNRLKGFYRRDKLRDHEKNVHGF
jgi:hypothetical protein